MIFSSVLARTEILHFRSLPGQSKDRSAGAQFDPQGQPRQDLGLAGMVFSAVTASLARSSASIFARALRSVLSARRIARRMNQNTSPTRIVGVTE